MATVIGPSRGSPSGPSRFRSEHLAARVRRFVRFGLVGMSGVLVNEAALALLVNALHVNYLVGAVLATQCSTVWNFALVEWWAFEGVGNRAGRGRRFVMFWAVNMVALGLRGPILAILTSVFHIHYLISNLISLGVLVVLRFAIADSLIWGKRPEPARPVSRDDLLAHFPLDVVEDLGWAVNPVAEAAEMIAPAPYAPLDALPPPATLPLPDAIPPPATLPAPPAIPTAAAFGLPDALPPPVTLTVSDDRTEPTPDLAPPTVERSGARTDARDEPTATGEARRYGSISPPPLFP